MEVELLETGGYGSGNMSKVEKRLPMEGMQANYNEIKAVNDVKFRNVIIKIEYGLKLY